MIKIFILVLSLKFLLKKYLTYCIKLQFCRNLLFLHHFVDSSINEEESHTEKLKTNDHKHNPWDDGHNQPKKPNQNQYNAHRAFQLRALKGKLFCSFIHTYSRGR